MDGAYVKVLNRVNCCLHNHIVRGTLPSSTTGIAIMSDTEPYREFISRAADWLKLKRQRT